MITKTNKVSDIGSKSMPSVNSGSVHAPITINHVPHVALIGFGPSGLFFIAHEVELRESNGLRLPVSYVIYEKTGELGRGVAWSARENQDFWANMIVQTIQMDPDARRIAREMGLQDNQEYVKRWLIGEWLSEYWKVVRSKASRLGISIDVINDTVLDVTPSIDGRYIVDAIAHSTTTDCVVLAVGQFPPNAFSNFHGEPNFYSNPWSHHADGSEHRTLILGAGLTSIDKTIELIASDMDSTITWASNRGLSPWVRPRSTPCTLSLTEATLREVAASHGGSLTLETIKGLIIQEILAQGLSIDDMLVRYQESCRNPVSALKAGLSRSRMNEPYFGFLKSLDYLLPAIWNVLDDSGRQEAKSIYSEYARFSFAIPEVTAVQLLRWIEHGVVRLVSGKWKFKHSETEGVYLLTTYNSDGLPEVERYHTVINATGFGQDIEKCQDTLIKNLRRRNLLVAHEFGGACCDFHTGQLIDGQGDPIHGIYTLNGSLNSGVRLFTNEMYEIAKQARRTSEAVNESLINQDIFSPKLAWVSNL